MLKVKTSAWCLTAISFLLKQNLILLKQALTTELLCRATLNQRKPEGFYKIIFPRKLVKRPKGQIHIRNVLIFNISLFESSDWSVFCWLPCLFSTLGSEILPVSWRAADEDVEDVDFASGCVQVRLDIALDW